MAPVLLLPFLLGCSVPFVPPVGVSFPWCDASLKSDIFWGPLRTFVSIFVFLPLVVDLVLVFSAARVVPPPVCANTNAAGAGTRTTVSSCLILFGLMEYYAFRPGATTRTFVQVHTQFCGAKVRMSGYRQPR